MEIEHGMCVWDVSVCNGSKLSANLQIDLDGHRQIRNVKR